MGKKNMKQVGDKQKGSPGKSPQKGVAVQSKGIGKKPFAGKGKPAEGDQKKQGRFQKPTNNKQLTNGVAKPNVNNKKVKPNQTENSPNKKGGKQQQPKDKPQQPKDKPQQQKGKPQQQKGKPQQQNEKPQQPKGKPQQKDKPQNEKKPQAKNVKPEAQKETTKEPKIKVKQQAVGQLKKNKNKPQTPEKKPETEDKPEAAATKAAITLNKRNKNRLKTEMKKEIILKGKDPVKLTDIKLLEKKLAKLVVKAEPRSNKVERKILLIQSLLVNVKNANKKAHKVVGSESTDKPTKAKKEKKAAAVVNGDSEHPKNDFVVFVGHLPPDVTKEVIKEHFSSVGELQKIRIPKPKRRKTKLFAYLQFADKETKEKALEMHGTKIGERVISVMYADKKGGKKTINRENGKLETQRKAAASITDKQMIDIGKKLKNKKKKNKATKPAKK